VFVSDANPNGAIGSRVLEAMVLELALILVPAAVEEAPVVVLVVLAPCKGTLGTFHAAPSTNNNDCWFPANNASVNTVAVTSRVEFHADRGVRKNNIEQWTAIVL